MNHSPRTHVFAAALKYSIPVMVGYLTIGAAFGFLMADAGYPWWLSLVMSVIIYAGAGQYIAVGLFAAGTSLWEAALVQLVVNVRHMAYGLSMLNRFRNIGPLRYYLIFGLTDETFALLSSLPQIDAGAKEREEAERAQFMFYVIVLNHCYWISGTLIGAVAGSLFPFSVEGIGFALTALFIVLMIEQIYKVRKPGIFIISAVLAVLGVVLLPSRMSLLAAMAFALALSSFMGKKDRSVAQ
ncbi:MAG: AzlC family ABC transporter permease [Treponema sp.]|jgi:4-azaleucine resistance transporter AzlC|nr:AzlC family ABC transporter permease [Treponema sp.]